jgi:hypothetical protein
VVEERRTELAGLIDRVWPAWRDVLADLVAAGLPPTLDGYGRLLDMERVAAIPDLPERINRRTAASLTASHSKASLTETRRGALGGTNISHDGSVRLRPPAGLSARTANGVVDLSGIAAVLGEVSIPERALLDGLAFEGTIRAVLLVENLGHGVTCPHRRAGCWPTCRVGRPLPSVTCWIVSKASPSCTSAT